MDHLRALLLLHSDPQRAWEEAELSGRLYLEPRRLGQVLDSLAEGGLVTRDAAAGRCQFVPQSGGNAALLEQVVAMDRERPVSLIRLIYEKRDSLEAFADAFRLRRNQ